MSLPDNYGPFRDGAKHHVTDIASIPREIDLIKWVLTHFYTCISN